MEQWVKKGDRLYDEGRIEDSQAEHEGITRYWTHIIVQALVMLGSTSPGPEGSQGSGGAPVAEPQPQPVTDPDDDLPY